MRKSETAHSENTEVSRLIPRKLTVNLELSIVLIVQFRFC